MTRPPVLSVLRDGLMRRSEAAALSWGDVEPHDNDSGLLQVRRSKTGPEGEGVTLYLGREAVEPLLDMKATVFGLSSRQSGRRVQAAALAAGLGNGFTGHVGRTLDPGPWSRAE